MSVQLDTATPVIPNRNPPVRALENLDFTRCLVKSFALTLAGGSVGAITLASLGIVSWSVGGVVAVPSALLALGVNIYHNQCLDYEGGDELQKMGAKASQMSLDDVILSYGWKEMLRLRIISPDQFRDKYRQQIHGKSIKEVIKHYEKMVGLLTQYAPSNSDYLIPRPSECTGLWQRETTGKNCEEIFQNYSLEVLGQYGVVKEGELACLKQLKCVYETIKREHAAAVAQIEEQFNEDTKPQRDDFKTRCQPARQLHTHRVKEVGEFELKQTQRREWILEAQSRRIEKARQKYHTALASGKKDKVDLAKRKWETEESNARRDTQQKIDALNRERPERFSNLQQKEKQARGEKERVVAGLKTGYQASIQEHLQRKEERLKPLHAALKSSIADCDARYRAYLRLQR
jgi:hypothetical protein